MATAGSHRTSSRTTRKIEAPRPLKESSLNESNAKSSYSPLALSSYTIDCVEKLIALMDMVVNSINQLGDVNTTVDPSLLSTNIILLCKHLKIYGPQLENSIYQGQLDRAFLSFREGMVRGLLEYEARLHLLEIVELRVSNWISHKDLSPVSIGAISQSPSYQDFGEYSDLSSYQSVDTSLGYGSEDVKRPVKPREKISKSASKSYLRNEVIIRNSDSGKVPPTAKERVVQITGPNEDNISYAARLIENTIRNNASPVKEFCESESSCSSEDSSYGTSGYDEYGNFCTNNQKSKFGSQPYLYKHEVIVRNCHLTITGDDYTYVTVAKAILDDYFSKLRNSESPENVNYNDDVFSDERFLKDENDSTKSGFHRLNDVAESGDCKPYAEDLADASYTISSTDDSCTYIDYDLLNPTCELRTDSALSSEVSSLSLTQNCGDALNDSSFPSKASEFAEYKASRTSYSKEFLLQLKNSESSQRKPEDWELITNKFPQLLKETEDSPELIVIDE